MPITLRVNLLCGLVGPLQYWLSSTAALVVVQDDVEQLAEDPHLAAYEAMPVDMFGEAMLRGMGWTEGKGIGLNKACYHCIVAL